MKKKQIKDKRPPNDRTKHRQKIRGHLNHREKKQGKRGGTEWVTWTLAKGGNHNAAKTP